MPTLESGAIRVQMDQATRISPITWKGAFAQISDISVTVFLRSGAMYGLYSLNEPVGYLSVETERIAVEGEGDAHCIAAEGVSRDLALRSRVRIVPERDEVRLDLHLAKLGVASAKFQFQCEVSYTVADDHHGMALVLPAGNAPAVLRPSDASEQEIFDQDGHTRFPRTVRLSDAWGMLSSCRDGKGVLFSTNLHYVAAWRRYRERLTRYFHIYGYDAFMDKGDEHAETFTFRLVPGLGGASVARDDAERGAGALLDRRNVTDEPTARVCFTSPSPPAATEARVTDGERTLVSASGAGDLDLDLSAMADGTYTVEKELRTDERTLVSREDLTVLRKTYADFAAARDRIASFIEAFDPDAQDDPQAARVRAALIRFKLAEIDAYLPLHETAQIEGLLGDAQRTIAAMEANEPAALPDKGDVIYSHDLSERCDDFDVFGNGAITFSPERGMCVDPVGTIDMWTKFTAAGSFAVAFDYFPFASRTGGSMLQLCGSHPNPISQYDFMCSASWGSMAYYMFGVRCYHFSFSRWGGLANRAQRICNFRKTGKGFYVLSLIEDPIGEPERWYHLDFVKERNHFMFFVDGTLAQEYFDEGHQGPFLDGGRIGIRNWSMYKSYFKNFEVTALPSGDSA